MSLAGFKKQINKANQFVSEKVGTAEATKLDDEYTELEKKIDVTNELVEDVMVKTREYLQPNPASWLAWNPMGASRAKMSTVNTISKLRGTTKSMPYPQPEGTLGESFAKYGKLLGDDSHFGRALCDAGEAFKQMADIKYALEDNVKQNFLDPLFHLQNKDLKECNYHRKKLQGRRLDYDCKKRKSPKDEEIRQAEEKLEESKQLAESAMYTVLSNDVEQISQLSALVSAQLDFHRQTVEVLASLQEILKERIGEAGKQPRMSHIPKPVLEDRSRSKSPSLMETSDHHHQPATTPSKNSPTGGASRPASQDPWATGGGGGGGGGQDPWGHAPPAYNAVTNGKPSGGSQNKQPCCRALYDFDPENQGELGFKEGQIITLTSKIDDNWYEGRLQSGAAGFFPVSYVEVVVPLP